MRLMTTPSLLTVPVGCSVAGVVLLAVAVVLLVVHAFSVVIDVSDSHATIINNEILVKFIILVLS